MKMTDEQKKLFERIKREFFVDPAPANSPEYLSKIQAHLSVLIRNMLEWYVLGSSYEPLRDALQRHLDTPRPRKNNGHASHEGLVNNSPLVIAKDWDLKNIELPFARSEFTTLREALPILDTDTGGAIRFNHHFLGELHPQGNILALAASLVSSFLNENAVIPKVSPSVTTWEKEVVRWIWRMLDGPGPRERNTTERQSESDREKAPKCDFKGGGRIVGGGTVANLTALFIAREEFRSWCEKAGRRPSEVRPVVLYSGHSHYSIRKAARVVGFAYDKDPTRSEMVGIVGRNYWYLTADDVAEAIQTANSRAQFVVMISVLAGATDTGYVDDLDGIAEVISEYNASPNRTGPRIYYHIDAAMGGPFRLISSLTWKEQEDEFSVTRRPAKPRKRRKQAPSLFDGVQRGDAITIDGHKYFYCNYPCGGIFVLREKDFDYLLEDAKYLESGESEDQEPEQLRKLYQSLGLTESPLRSLELEGRDRRGLRTLEGSRGITGITQLYVTLKVLGPDGIKALLQHSLDMTKKLRELIKQTKPNKKRKKPKGTSTFPSLELITNGPLNQTLFRVVTDWDHRTDPDQIDRDNDINFLIPHYANWTQTGKLRELLSENGRNSKTPTSRVVKGILKDRHTIPFYVGTDQPLDHLPDDKSARSRLMQSFLDYVWRINDEDEKGRCPAGHKQNVERWLASVRDPKNPTSKKRSLQVLKAIITHPYTDEIVLKKFIGDICEGARVIQEILGKQRDK